MKIVLAGTPQFVVPIFKIIAQHFDVVGIISQPNKTKGRGLILQKTPVAQFAIDNQLRLFQPQKIDTIYEELKNLNYDLLLTFAYGQYISKRILDLGKYDPLNIHGSLLPSWRGSSPLQYAIFNQDQKTGVTLMQMSSKMDAGPIIAQASFNLNPQMTFGQALQNLTTLTQTKIVDWLKMYFLKKLKPIMQEGTPTYSPKIDDQFRKLNPKLTISQNLSKIRALNPTPGALWEVDQKLVKVYDAQKEKIKNVPIIKCLDGNLYANDYLFPSKKRIKINL